VSLFKAFLMKRLKTMMTVVAFALAIGGAFGFKSLTHSGRLPTAWEKMGEGCLRSFLLPGCGTTGTQICTSYYQDATCTDPYYYSE
jgi:hypothetical protein